MVTNPDCVPASRWVLVLREAAYWRAVVVTLKHKIVAEDKPLALGNRTRQFRKEGLDDPYEDLDGSHLSVTNRPATSRYPDCGSRFSRRLQLAPGLVPPSSWSLSPCIGPATICAQNWSDVQVLAQFISNLREMP
jgi:hypothetical protein